MKTDDETVRAAVAGVLLTCGPWMTARDIGRHIGCDGASVKRVLDGMRARGVVDSRLVTVPGTPDRFTMFRAQPAIIGELCGSTSKGARA
jgi:hypothetical protein